MLAKTFVTLALVGAAIATPATVKRATGTFPTAPKTSSLSEPITIKAGESFTPPDEFTRYDRGSGACTEQAEGGDSDAVFLLEEGATLNNVVIGKDQAEGIHCLGACTLNEVWFEDVCEDAITIKQKSGTSYINGGGAKSADDKVVQHNGAGTVVIDGFYVESFGKLYRSCGNCSTQYKRAVIIKNVNAVDGKLLAGVNENYGDTATITATTVSSVKEICEQFEGNDEGDEPPSTGTGPSTACVYKESDITES